MDCGICSSQSGAFHCSQCVHATIKDHCRDEANLRRSTAHLESEIHSAIRSALAKRSSRISRLTPSTSAGDSRDPALLASTSLTTTGTTGTTTNTSTITINNINNNNTRDTYVDGVPLFYVSAYNNHISCLRSTHEITVLAERMKAENHQRQLLLSRLKDDLSSQRRALTQAQTTLSSEETLDTVWRSTQSRLARRNSYFKLLLQSRRLLVLESVRIFHVKPQNIQRILSEMEAERALSGGNDGVAQIPVDSGDDTYSPRGAVSNPLSASSIANTFDYEREATSKGRARLLRDESVGTIYGIPLPIFSNHVELGAARDTNVAVMYVVQLVNMLSAYMGVSLPFVPRLDGTIAPLATMRVGDVVGHHQSKSKTRSKSRKHRTKRQEGSHVNSNNNKDEDNNKDTQHAAGLAHGKDTTIGNGNGGGSRLEALVETTTTTTTGTKNMNDNNKVKSGQKQDEEVSPQESIGKDDWDSINSGTPMSAAPLDEDYDVVPSDMQGQGQGNQQNSMSSILTNYGSSMAAAVASAAKMSASDMMASGKQAIGAAVDRTTSAVTRSRQGSVDATGPSSTGGGSRTRDNDISSFVDAANTGAIAAATAAANIGNSLFQTASANWKSIRNSEGVSNSVGKVVNSQVPTLAAKVTFKFVKGALDGINNLGIRPRITIGGGKGNQSSGGMLSSGLDTNSVEPIMEVLTKLDKIMEINSEFGSLTMPTSSSNGVDAEVGGDFEMGLAMLAYNCAYLCYSQGVQVPLYATVDILGMISLLCDSLEGLNTEKLVALSIAMTQTNGDTQMEAAEEATSKLKTSLEVISTLRGEVQRVSKIRFAEKSSSDETGTSLESPDWTAFNRIIDEHRGDLELAKEVELEASRGSVTRPLLWNFDFPLSFVKVYKMVLFSRRVSSKEFIAVVKSSESEPSRDPAGSRSVSFFGKCIGSVLDDDEYLTDEGENDYLDDMLVEIDDDEIESLVGEEGSEASSAATSNATNSRPHSRAESVAGTNNNTNTNNNISEEDAIPLNGPSAPEDDTEAQMRGAALEIGRAAADARPRDPWVVLE